MDKKIKKRVELLRIKIQRLQQQLAGSRQQHDDPEEHRQLVDQLTAAEKELHELQGSA